MKQVPGSRITYGAFQQIGIAIAVAKGKPAALAAVTEFMDDAKKANKPFFLWHNTTRMHVFTYLSPQYQAKMNATSNYNVEEAGMAQLDDCVGDLLKHLDDIGEADNTIVIFTTDNGAEVCTWPDGGATPFRGEKDTNYEGAWRVPCAIRWPGVIKPGTISNEIFSHMDMLPTLLAAAGEPDVVEKLKEGHKVGKKTFKVHMDGYNMVPFWKGEVKEDPRKGIMYWSDDGDLMALRVGNWKAHFLEQRNLGLAIWQDPFVSLRAPKLFNLRSDPFERGEESIFYGKWFADRMFALIPAQAIVAEFIGADRGLGYLILTSSGAMRTAVMFGVLLLLSVLGTLCFYAVVMLERMLCPWYMAKADRVSL